MIKQQFSNKDLEPVCELLNHVYCGDLFAIINELDEVMFMLFYLEEEVFNYEERTNAAYTLKRLKDVFFEMVRKKNSID